LLEETGVKGPVTELEGYREGMPSQIGLTRVDKNLKLPGPFLQKSRLFVYNYRNATQFRVIAKFTFGIERGPRSFAPPHAH